MKLNRNLYHQILNDKTDSPSYDFTHRDRFIYIVNTINKNFKNPDKTKVLDFGSHIGSISILLKHFGYDITGIDIDEVISKHTNKYKNSNKLNAEFIGRGGAWLDAGSIKDLYDASTFVSTLENRQGLKIACLEEIALGNGWINKKQIQSAIKFYGKCDYSNYLNQLIK